MKRIVFFFLCFSFVAFSQQVNFKNAKFTRERTMDILNYLFNISINENEKSISGRVTVTFLPLRTEYKVLELDASELNITNVTIGDKQLRYYTKGSTLSIPLDKTYGLNDTISVAIEYDAKPKKGLYFIPPDPAQPEKTWQIWSQGESEENHWWFPCYDYPNDKATTEMVVTVSDNLTAISNGGFIDSKNNNNGTTTFHYKESKPFSSYLISLIVGEFTKLSDNVDGIPLEYFVRPSQKDRALNSFSKTALMLKYFSDKIHFTYPWEKYTQVAVSDYMFGGMENTTVAT